MGLLTKISDALTGKAPLDADRSKDWPKVRAKHIKENGECAICGSKSKLEVHHIIPFHVDPELELSPKNLITLCESGSGGVTCHLFFGHLGNYKSYNSDIVEDAKVWKSKIKKRPSV